MQETILVGCGRLPFGFGGVRWDRRSGGDEGERDTQATQLPMENATGGVREGAGQTTRGRGRSASGLDVVIASCEWQAGGQLDLTFTIENTEDALRFGNFRLKSESGAIYRPPGVKSDISVPPGETREYSASADKFPAGSEAFPGGV